MNLICLLQVSWLELLPDSNQRSCLLRLIQSGHGHLIVSTQLSAHSYQWYQLYDYLPFFPPPERSAVGDITSLLTPSSLVTLAKCHVCWIFFFSKYQLFVWLISPTDSLWLICLHPVCVGSLLLLARALVCSYFPPLNLEGSRHAIDLKSFLHPPNRHLTL